MANLDGSEQVLAIERGVLGLLGPWQGFRPHQGDAGRLWRRLLLEHATFRPRTEELEHGQPGLAWLQVIPYGVLKHRGRVFCFRRPAKGGDRRLAGRLSIGLGGHANPIDRRADPGDEPTPQTLGACLSRELREEMGLLEVATFPTLAGWLRDDSNDVGQRHLGVVYTCEVEPGDVVPQAAEVEPVGWLTRAELRARPAADWETWSAILVEALDQVLGPVPV